MPERYEIRRYFDDDGVVSSASDPFFNTDFGVYDTTDIDYLGGVWIARPLTEAVAHIIAFALNAVADGKKLACAADDGDPEIDDYEWDIYDGPTEGVAPS